MNKITARTIKEIYTERRKFLDMLSKAGVSAGLMRAAPLVGGLMSVRFAEAAATADKKFILIYHPNGGPRNYLNSVAINPLKPFASSVAALTMSIGKPGNHGNIHFAAGAISYNRDDAMSSSIDQQIAKVIGNNTPQRSIQLGVQSGTQEGINRLNGAAVTRIDNPQTAIDRYFSGGSTIITNDRKLSILDANKQGLDAIRNKLGFDERYRLEEHLATLNQLETRLRASQTSTTSGSCANPAVPITKSALVEYRTQGDIAVAALACGLTNVVSIQFNETNASWLPGDGTADAVPFNADHHQVNHGSQATDLLPLVSEYMNKGVANIIDKLQKAGIYNQTVVLVISEMGDGANHEPDGGPITVASGIPGFRAGNRAIGLDHHNIFADVVKLLGLQGSVGGIIANYGSGGIAS